MYWIRKYYSEYLQRQLVKKLLVEFRYSWVVRIHMAYFSEGLVDTSLSSSF